MLLIGILMPCKQSAEKFHVAILKVLEIFLQHCDISSIVLLT
ncbi:hypothetical protein APHCRT_1152 [Anaplasma phagocytophilum str. CRT53-1]|uniref:Uncharacterized protein n=3 Tax=Anaplasma phagocytophilum TaxID=948 RepID=A0A0F3N7I0_ANAPH|nr:hypothetical protein YYU_04630 [Anaplasma phagocytophilum str. HZ2]AGR80856.1 hypothetical protein WSQ_04660 [Anaplasma phagocytophilum str. JM]AGR82109.1 hypothetical protein YYY_04655 [Anaplasma phagocytophilum str. Dog2]KJV60174.1 hypothetical protein APHWEB_0980 [Anaplasma phagocytophilum str. Webster]KJV62889.1 hypothetical protein EPHNCH_1349 [Anaplasma phagocytophilum str. NCH-1]KJV82897.1 hypothetical protein APHHGE2_1329 [Anaplasma phagocytophilum str. HGE2]KJV83994.1 hypothetical